MTRASCAVTYQLLIVSGIAVHKSRNLSSSYILRYVGFSVVGDTLSLIQNPRDVCNGLDNTWHMMCLRFPESVLMKLRQFFVEGLFVNYAK